ncbi:sulfite exporter TauE/SafE family protein [Methylosinus sp. Sm6]|uniref:sulfite exporter TauE/SafE family protein n=1 Tax=Methylosinus sp. Sm6 TaxID=2866948 RepID=UPI001C9A2415|nr:sulfite exporter TauE/SafE family protein [Methylosinus sp. Sm6]
MTLELVQYVIAAACGGGIGFTLGLIGGGGSVLAVPLLVYVVGVTDPHIAIGTSAFAVAINAAFSLFNHARAGSVKWRCGGMYAAAGTLGAVVGSTLGKSFDGPKLLFLFAFVMILTGVLMLRGRGRSGNAAVECTFERAPKVGATGFVTGLFSGFFGIGGGVLVVPGLVGSTGMPMINAVGTSLVAVTIFGLTTALNYATSDLVDWLLAAVLIGSGGVGTLFGVATARRMSKKTGQLTIAFAVVVFAVAAYMLMKSTWLLG